MGMFWHDLHYAVRALRRAPGFSLAATFTLTLAIGLNTTFFTAINTIALREWPVDDAGSVVRVFAGSGNNQTTDFTATEYEWLREHSKSFSALAAVNRAGADIRITAGGPVVTVNAAYVTPSLFTVLRLPLMTGRPLMTGDDRPGTPAAAAVVSERFWRRHFGNDAPAAGRMLYAGDLPVTIVGVTAGRVAEVHQALSDVWLPMAAFALLGDASESDVAIVGRLAPGVAMRSAQAELAVLTRQTYAAAGRTAPGVTLRYTSAGANRRVVAPALLMLGAFVAVLLLACANVGNLQLARGLGRHREVAVRLSLGASRWRVVRQLLTENLVLCFVSGALGLALGSAALPVLMQTLEVRALPLPWAIDATVLGFSVLISSVAALVTGLAPALHSTRVGTLFGAAERSGGAPAPQSFRSVLMGVQIALCAMLLLSAALLTRGLARAIGLDPGFAMAETLVAQVQPPEDTYDFARGRAVTAQIADALAASGIRPVGLADVKPLASSRLMMSVRKPGEPPRAARSVHLRPLSPASFEVLQIPLVSGRMFTDRPDGGEAVVNESMARAFWPDRSPLGETLLDRARAYRIVGVVKDTFLTDLARVEPTIHTPPLVASFPFFLVRRGATALDARLRAIAGSIDPRLTVQVTPLRDVLDDALWQSQVGARIAWGIAGLGLLLATIGVAGVFALIVGSRTREIGVRMALGATAVQVIPTVFAVTARPVVSGLAGGVLLSLAAGRVLAAYLYGLSPLDPLAYVEVLAILLVAAIVATCVPARRAMRVDPAVALRAE